MATAYDHRQGPASGTLRISRPLVVLGTHGSHSKEAVRAQADELGVPMLVGEGSVPDTGSLAPLAFLVPATGGGGHAACVQIRVRRQFAHVPILALADEPSDLDFSEAFSHGADDVVPLSCPDRLRTRLRNLARASNEVALPAGRKGIGVVAGADATWRAVMGRTLANGGYEVRFALSGHDAAAYSPKLVVADEAAMRASLEVIASRRADGPSWVVLAEPRRIATAKHDTSAFARVAVTDAFSPPENVLFLANEMGHEVASRRASPRVLYGTCVSFRAAGREKDDVGFTYNLSGGGLYVRTLAPLDAGQEAWLELWPPRGERRVRLAGRVVWRRAYGQSETATVPPGFGVQLQGGLGEDLERYALGYERISKSE